MSYSAKGKVVPDAERAVLGSMLIDPDAARVVRLRLEAGDFDATAHRLIYSAMLAVMDSGAPPDSVMVMEKLREQNLLGDVGGPTYLLKDCIGAVATTSHAEHYAGIVREASLQRQFHNQLDRAAADKSPENVTLLRDLAMQLEGVRADPVFDFQKDLGAALEEYAEMEPHIVDTGFSGLDDALGGLELGDVLTIGARTNGGKTAMKTCLMMNMARAKLSCLYLTTEMRTRQMIYRVLPQVTRIPAFKFRRHILSPQEWTVTVEKAGSELAPLPIKVYGKSQLSLEDIRSAVIRAKPQVVFIDYLQRCRFPKADSRAYAIGDFMVGLKSFAQDLGILVVISCQLDRQRDRKPNEAPTLADLKDSGAIEAESDEVVLLWRPPEEYLNKVPDFVPPEEPNYCIEGIVAKHRHGAAGIRRLFELNGELVQVLDWGKKPVQPELGLETQQQENYDL